MPCLQFGHGTASDFVDESPVVEDAPLAAASPLKLLTHQASACFLGFVCCALRLSRDVLIIDYIDKKLEKTCHSAKDLQKHYGEVCGKLIGRRLDEMKVASSLSVLLTLPQARCHELTKNRKGQLSVDAKHPYRLIFRPNHVPVPTNSNGGLDWTLVTSVTILEIVDYHGN